MASGWLQVSVTRAEPYVDANLSRYGRRKHNQESIDTVCHRDFDFPIDGEAYSTLLPASEPIAKFVVFVSTSTGEYQALCRVDDAILERQNRTLKLLAITFRRDPACTDCDVVLRQPGFLNFEYDPAYPLIVECPCDSTSSPGRFRLDITAENAILRPVQFHCESVPKGTPIPTTSWRDLLKNLGTENGTGRELRMLPLLCTDVPSSFSLSRPSVRCRNRPQFVVSTLSRRTTLWTKLKVCHPWRFPPPFAPLVHDETGLTALRFTAWKQISSSPHLRGDNAIREIRHSLRISGSIRLDGLTAEQIDQLAAFVRASAVDVVDNSSKISSRSS